MSATANGFRVCFTGYYWSGSSIIKTLPELPEIGQQIERATWDSHTRANDYVVAGRKRRKVCACCGSTVSENSTVKSEDEWVIYVENTTDAPRLRDYYSGFATD